jgi:hypothetical protein
LASKFTEDHFKRIQINITFVQETESYPALKLVDVNVQNAEILPKHIQMNSKHYLNILHLKKILLSLNSSKLYSFNEFEV